MFINSKNCIGCGCCQDMCPVDSIAELNQRFFIDQTVCIECGECQSVCPARAITDMPE